MEELWKMCPSLGWLVRVSARRFPKNTAVIFQGEETSYAELDRLSDSVAWVLKDHGVGPGDSVALSLPNSPAFVAGYFGILKTGASVVPINLLLSAEEVAYIVSDAGVKAGIYWCGAGVDLCNLQEKGCRFSCLIAGNAGGRPGCLSLKEVLKRDCPAVEIPGLNQTEDVAAIIYTSGTTGQPKGAMLTHRNLLFNVNSVVSSLPLSEKDRFIAVLPMFHAFGATACMLVPLALGATIVALTRFVPEEVVKIIEVTRATVFMGVPSMYALLAQIPQRQLDFSSLRFCISGGAPLPAEVLERFEKRYGVLIYEGDGPTECSPVTAVNPVGGRRKISSIGLP
ncbi:MAG TPA: AMP-binding protein, partial [bacterium]|nr:AMP-binding protein [bacterium]